MSLGEIVVRAFAHRLDADLLADRPGDDDEGQFETAFLEGGQRLEAGEPGSW
jgi:hypothetical protein